MNRKRWWIKFVPYLSIFVLLFGLGSLFFSIQLTEDLLLQSTDSLPQETLVSFPAKVTGEYATENGFVLELSRDEIIMAYLDYPLNQSIQDEKVLVTGRNEFFMLKEEQVKNPDYVITGKLLDLAAENNFTYETWYLSDNVVIYSLKLNMIGMKEPYIFSLGAKYDW